MTKKVYSESVKKWAKRIGITGTTLVGLFFAYLFVIGAISNVSYSGDVVCAGTIEDPCYAYINFTANEDIFIYPTEYDPWRRNTTFNFDPNVKEWHLYRSWGSGWREINLSTNCKGTWCGASDNSGDTVYSIAFRKGKTYQIRIMALKNSPYETIKWGAFSGVDKIDPKWLGLEKTKQKETWNVKPKLVQYEIDENYPCHIENEDEIVCPALSDKEIENWKTKLSISDIVDKESKIIKLDSKKTLYSGVEEKEIDVTKEYREKIDLLSMKSEIKIGFGTNIFNLSSSPYENFEINETNGTISYKPLNRTWLTLDGVNDITNNAIPWDCVNTNSLSFWLKTSDGGTQYIMYRTNTYLYLSNGDLRFRVRTTGGFYGEPFIISAGLNDGEWHHIVYAQEGLAGDDVNLTAYVDGVYYTSVIWPGYSLNYDYPLGYTSNSFGGGLDEFRTYSVDLTDEEVLEIYNSGRYHNSSLPSTGLTRWYSFNENYGTTSYDYTGNLDISNGDTIYGNDGIYVDNLGYNVDISVENMEKVKIVWDNSTVIESIFTGAKNFTFFENQSIFVSYPEFTLDILMPTTASPDYVSSGENISVNFNVSAEGTEIITGVILDTIYIGGTIVNTVWNWVETNVFSVRLDDDGPANDGSEQVTFTAMPNTNYAALAQPFTDADDVVYSVASSTKATTYTNWNLEDDTGAREAVAFMYGAFEHGHFTYNDTHVECGSETGSFSRKQVLFDEEFPDTNYAFICNPGDDTDSPICILYDGNYPKATTGTGVYINDDGGSSEYVSRVDWCAFQHGEYNFGEDLIVKSGSQSVTDGAMTVEFEGDFATADYVVFITDVTSATADGCACEVDSRDVGNFTASCADDGESMANCDETFDWVAINKGDYDSSFIEFLEEFGYVGGDVGWQVNITVPDLSNGFKDLFLNTTIGTSSANDTSENSIAYGSFCMDITSPGIYQLKSDVESEGTCYNISANDVILDCNGHTINYSTSGNASQYGIYDEGNSTIIKNCNIIDGNESSNSQRDGIHLEGSNNWTIFNNTVSVGSTSSYGIYQVDANENSNLSNNYLYSSEYYGAYIRYSNLSVFENNIFNSTSSYGVYIRDSTFSNFSNNRGYSSSSNALYLNNFDDGIIEDSTGNSTGTGYGFYMTSSDRNQIRNNTGQAISSEGFRVNSGDYNNISFCIGIADSINGLEIGSGSDYNNITNCEGYSNSDTGFYLYNSDHNILINNYGYSATDIGSERYLSHYNTIINETGISGSYIGFDLGSSNYNTIINSTGKSLGSSALSVGMYAQNSNDNNFTNCYSSSVDDVGFFLFNDYNFIIDNQYSSGTSSASYAYYLQGGSHDNLIKDCNYTSGDTYDIYSRNNNGNNYDNIFLNCSYDVEQVESGDSLIRKWYIEVRANSTTDYLNGATVDIYNLSSDNVFSQSTDANGQTTPQRFEAIEYIRVYTTLNYATPHSINVTKVGYTENSTIVDLDAEENYFYWAILEEGGGACDCPGSGSNWEINMEDECHLTEACNLGVGNLSWIGSSGFFNCSAQLNLTNRNAPPSGTTFYYSGGCEVNRQ